MPSSDKAKIIYENARKMSLKEFEAFLSTNYCAIRLKRVQKSNASDLDTMDLIEALKNINKDGDSSEVNQDD